MHGNWRLYGWLSVSDFYTEFNVNFDTHRHTLQFDLLLDNIFWCREDRHTLCRWWQSSLNVGWFVYRCKWWGKAEVVQAARSVHFRKREESINKFKGIGTVSGFGVQMNQCHLIQTICLWRVMSGKCFSLWIAWNTVILHNSVIFRWRKSFLRPVYQCDTDRLLFGTRTRNCGYNYSTNSIV